MKATVAVLLAVSALSCSSGRELPVTAPEVRVAQTGAAGFVQERGGLFSVDYLIQIENRAGIPIVADSVEIQSVGGGPYTVRPTPIELKREIGAGKTEVLEVSAWAYSAGGRTAAIEPVTLRMTIRFIAGDEPFHINVVRRVEQN